MLTAAELKVKNIQTVVKLRGYVRLSSGQFSNALHLFSLGDPAAGNDDNLVFFVKRYNLCNTVGGTGMVDVAGKEKKRSVKNKNKKRGFTMR